MLLVQFLAIAVMRGEAATPLPVLLDRARVFQRAGLAPLAREQYSHILKLHPGNKEASKALGDLVSKETDERMRSALAAHKAGALDIAVFQVNRTLAIAPKETQALDLKKKLVQEQKLKKQLEAQVSKDYLKGVELYRTGRLDLALANFVRVLNLDPSNKGALDYIQKIGDRLKLTSPEGARKP